MKLAAERESSAKEASPAHIGEQLAPENRLGAQLRKVPQAEQAMSRSGQRHTDAIVCAEKPNRSLDVAADQRQQDDVILLPLIVVNSAHSHTKKLIPWHPFLESIKLSSVCGEDRDL